MDNISLALMIYVLVFYHEIRDLPSKAGYYFYAAVTAVMLSLAAIYAANICDNYMKVLRDGGALYAWCSGRDKVWRHNCGYRAFTDDWGVRAIHIDDWDGFNDISENLFHASGATDNSQTNGTRGGRGDGTRTDLDVWDDTLGDNVWRKNVITSDVLPEGYLALRRTIRETAGGWLGTLPGAEKTIEDDLLPAETNA